MWPRYARIAALLVMSQLAAMAQGEEIRMSTRMAESLRHVRFFVGEGRIQATPRYVAARNIRDSAQSIFSGDKENLSLLVQRGIPTIKYVRTRPTLTLSIELVDGDRLVIERESKDPVKTVPLRFEQRREEDLQLSVGTGANRRVIQARSLWHLLLAEPDLCQRELVPLLKLLQPGWQLMETTAAVEKSLFEIAESHASQDRKRLKALVARLASDRFAERRTAERALQRLGESALPYLLALDPGALDPEQRRRIRRLTDRTTSGGEDDVVQIAARLSADRDVWLALMGRSEAAERRLAAEQLAELLDRAIEFDAEADEKTRATQLNQLRLKFAKRPTPLWD